MMMITISKDLKTKGSISFFFALFHNALHFLMCLICKGNMLVIKYLFLCHNFFSFVVQKKKKRQARLKLLTISGTCLLKKYTTLHEFTMCCFYFFCWTLRSHICTITENVYEVYYLKWSQLSCIYSISGNTALKYKWGYVTGQSSKPRQIMLNSWFKRLRKEFKKATPGLT